jgi:crossover junction endodeoxyribonuclease RuvC
LRHRALGDNLFRAIARQHDDFLLVHSPERPNLTTVNLGISPKELARIESRLSARKRSSAPEPLAGLPSSKCRRLLGIDPSLRGTGFGVIEVARGQSGAKAQGTIRCPADWEPSRCLAKIFQTIQSVIREQAPEICVVEGLFYAQNMRTALIMGQARGAALAAAAAAGLEIYELAPRRVKQAVVGYGAASKDAVARMVQRQLNLAELPEPDAADALAVALAFTQSQGRHGLTVLKRI